MKRFLRSLCRHLRVLLLIATGLLVADFAAADSIITVTDCDSNAQLVLEIENMFGTSPPWTTAANVATIDYWLSLVSDPGDSDSLMAELLEPDLASILAAEDASGTLPLDTSDGDGSASGTSEPATLVLLGSSLFFFMGRDNNLIDPAAIEYILKNSVREPDILARLREETASHPNARYQIPPEQGQFLQLLIRMMGARRTLEVGVFTGYSSLAVALALPPDGRIVACDISEEFTSIARRYWAEAGVSGKIDLRIAPAADTLDGLIQSGQSGTFDFAFIDADKSGYPRYYEQCLALIRSGGLIALDNMLFSGRVIDESDRSDDAVALRKINRLIHQDDRVDAVLLPFADGLTLAVKR